MTIELTEERKLQIILNSVIAAGPDADDTKIAAKIQQTANLLSDGSIAFNAFNAAEKRASITTDVKTFVGSILYVDKEGLAIGDKQPSNRPIVFAFTQPSEYAPDGVEVFRLDRLDASGGIGEQSRALAKTATTLVGHKVLITLAIEKANGKNVRILRGLEDRGADDSLAGLDNSNGWQRVNWQDQRFAPIKPRLQALNTKYLAQPALAAA